MKAYLKSIIGATALGMALLATTVPTWAGYYYPSLEVNTGTGNGHITVWGSLNGARYSPDTTQSIGCTVAQATTYQYVRCTAVYHTGAVHTCRTDDPKLIAVAHAMTSDSYIEFFFRKGGSTCEQVRVVNGSTMIR